MIKYQFREPLTIKNSDKADAQKIGESLTAIAATTDGELMPKSVVEAARNPKSPLHKHFEWDNEVAAEAHRLDQARRLIRCIRVEDEEASEGHAPAFVSITDKGRVSYRTTSEVRNSEHLQMLVLAAAERDLEAFEKRYRDLQDVCKPVRQARELVRAKLTKKSESRAVS